VSGTVTKNIARMWNQSFASRRDDERGAESTEVIFILVIVVLGLTAAFITLKNVIAKKAGDVGTCVNGTVATKAC
jgi:Flp pilus assembly pilin Flp